jgi:glyoxylase-like metal-dependent hydrolase (beta-lactamase superfamily II)
VLTLGHREWQALGSPGHDADSLMFHCEGEGILISGDALWEDGSGAIFPSDDPGTTQEDFGAAFETFDLVESLQVNVVVPGHGRPFQDVEGALGRARSRLRHLGSDPAKNARHVVKVLLKYRLLDLRRMAIDDVVRMFDEVPMIGYANRDIGLPPDVLARRTIDDLVRVGAVRVEGEVVYDV